MCGRAQEPRTQVAGLCILRWSLGIGHKSLPQEHLLGIRLPPSPAQCTQGCVPPTMTWGPGPQRAGHIADHTARVRWVQRAWDPMLGQGQMGEVGAGLGRQSGTPGPHSAARHPPARGTGQWQATHLKALRAVRPWRAHAPGPRWLGRGSCAPPCSARCGLRQR